MAHSGTVCTTGCDSAERLRFRRHGAELFAGAMSGAELALVEEAAGAILRGRPGVRVGEAALPPALLGRESSAARIAAQVLGPEAKPVRAVLFDKSAEANWSVGWHQDRTIVVRQRRDVAGYGAWTVKDGLVQVEPPFAVTAGMITLRLHVDDCDADNAPLLIAPGSHKRGRIPVQDIPAVVTKCGQRTCLACRGDIWAYSTAILHASEAARQPRRRRVLQLDYAREPLAGGLEWHALS